MLHLPIELLFDILDCSHFNKTAFPDYSTLRSLSLVCRDLELPAQKALFRTVNLARRKQAESFIRATQHGTEKGSWLGSCVRFLTIKAEDAVKPSKSEIVFADFVTILLRCTQLQALVLRSFRESSGSPFTAADLSLMDDAAPTTLRSITAPDCRLAFILIEAACPQVVSLSLGGRTIAHHRPTHPLETKNLLEIQWFGTTSTLVGALEEWLDCSSLEILGLRNIALADVVATERVLRRVGPNLRSLRLKKCPKGTAESIRQHACKLEEFILDDIPNGSVLDALPKTTLRHLEIRAVNDRDVHYDHVRPICNWIRSATSLMVVTWNIGHCSTETYSQLQLACTEVAAQLRIYGGHFGLYTGEQDALALAQVRSFPRPLELSPLRPRNKQLYDNIGEYMIQEYGESSQKPKRCPIQKDALTIPSVLKSFLPKNSSSKFTFSMSLSDTHKAPGSFAKSKASTS
ncbi:hypothetical protein FRC03_008345 [Tulasnella sp. 419]|nr:hypothetical protein FRC03_008345 [Tulasnella sp. 419]